MNNNNDRVFRITSYTNFGNGWEYPKKYLYDSEIAYSRQLKTKHTQNTSYARYSKTKIICEEFVNNSWITLEERVYG